MQSEGDSTLQDGSKGNLVKFCFLQFQHFTFPVRFVLSYTFFTSVVLILKKFRLSTFFDGSHVEFCSILTEKLAGNLHSELVQI